MVYKALRLTRQFYRMKQAQLANKLDISPSYLSEIEGGKKTISVDLLNRYAQIFNLPVDTFLRFQENNSQADPKREERGRKLLQFFEWVAQETNDDKTEEASSKAGNAEEAVRSS